jgi:hypothetical protein
VASNLFRQTRLQAPVVADFAEALDPANYVSVPDGWFVAVGDVVQSTAAIAKGRYKDVNLAGAATIAGTLNACGIDDLPFAFGGDGAVVLVPPHLADRTRTALQGIQKISRNALALDMRCALIPLAAIRDRGQDVKIAYQTLGPARTLAMLSGGGIDAAETLIKLPEGAPFLVTADASTEDADLTGLSCRWQPLTARNGVMLTAIVRAKQTGLSPSYRAVYDRIRRAIAHDDCPVALSNLKSSWPPRGAGRERAFHRTLFQVYGQSFLAKVSEITGATIGGFDGRAYARALPSHSDHRKFADSLRMVVDCAESEADRVETILKQAKAAGEIDFGLHRASAALMTCFVRNTQDGGHVHFIDGADGGYALAAQSLKSGSTSQI